jgi:hypothetical protein
MEKVKSRTAGPLLLLLAGLLCTNGVAPAETSATVSQIDAADFDRQIRAFLQKEVTAHVADIKTLNPPPERVVGALTTGEFSWGSFMRTLGVYSELFGTRTIAGQDVPQMIGKMAQIELSTLCLVSVRT